MPIGGASRPQYFPLSETASLDITLPFTVKGVPRLFVLLLLFTMLRDPIDFRLANSLFRSLVCPETDLLPQYPSESEDVLLNMEEHLGYVKHRLRV
jgi:hypothetical protein